MEISISGRERLRPFRWQTFEMTLTNNGNVDAVGVPYFLAIPASADIDFKFERGMVDTMAYVDSGLNDYTLVDTLNGQPFDAKVYWLAAPIVRANESVTYSFRLRLSSTGNTQITAWAQAPLYGSPLNPSAKKCLSGIMSGIMEIIGSDYLNCATSIYDLAVAPLISLYKGEVNTFGAAVTQTIDIKASLVTGITSCAAAGFPLGKIPKMVVKLSNWASNYSKLKTVYNLTCCVEKCLPVDPDDPTAKKPPMPIPTVQPTPINVVTSFDPNEIVGPRGFDETKYTKGQGSQTYIVYFENVDTAQAPAQEVWVFDTLDLSRFDAQSFSFDKVVFKDKTIRLPRNTFQFTSDVDLQPEQDILLRINAKFNPSTGVICWQFLSIDPVTMDFTENSDLGLLFPNINPPEGEGHVSYNVKFLESLVTNDEIENQAKIVFDFNEPIFTNVWLNTIDITPPVSSVNSLQMTSGNLEIPISITGNDLGAGIASYDLYVSVNGGEFKGELYSMPQNFIFKGEIDSTYAFYSVAVDSVGNKEVKSPQAEASTTIVSSSELVVSIESYIVFPNPTERDLTVSYMGTENIKKLKLTLINVLGESVATYSYNNVSPNERLSLDINELKSGMYYLYFDDTKKGFSTKIIKQ